MEKIILASGSPRRKELLELGEIPFEVVISKAEEITTETEPGKIVEELSACKAAAVAAEYPDRLVLGSDTIVTMDGQILGKPKDQEDACRMIRALQGRAHQVFTGVTLMKNGRKTSFHEAAKVYVVPMTEEEIRDYVNTKEPMDKAGAYGIQGRFAKYVEKIEGDYYTIVGLPLCRVYRELKKRE